jgi:hypothetical protein
MCHLQIHHARAGRRILGRTAKLLAVHGENPGMVAAMSLRQEVSNLAYRLHIVDRLQSDGEGG